jgi:hypothetical protein
VTSNIDIANLIRRDKSQFQARAQFEAAVFVLAFCLTLEIAVAISLAVLA